MTARAGHLAIDPSARDVSDLRERLGETGEGADVGGAPKGCVKSLQPLRSAAASAICASTAARRRALVQADVALARDPRTARRGSAPRCAHGCRPGSAPPGRVAAARARANATRERAARDLAARAASAPGAGSSTIWVRHHSPSPSRSGSCATRPAACRSSSQRCTLRRCARTNRARSARVARDLAPAHHRRQPRHQLPDRRREPRRALRVPEPEQVALDRVRARLQPIVTRRRAPARSPRATQQRVDHQPPGLGRQRLDRRPIPTTRRPSSSTSGCAIQRHRQRPKAPRQRSATRRRADARGTAGTGLTSRTARSAQAHGESTPQNGD